MKKLLLHCGIGVGVFRSIRSGRAWRGWVLSCMLLLSGTIAVGQTLDRTVTLNLRNVSLNDVLAEMKRQTGETFVFNTADLPASRNVTAVYQEAAINTVLDDLLPPRGLNYKTIEDYVVIFKVDPPGCVAPSQ